MAGRIHVVRPGDWLGAVARAFGFSHWSVLWDHADNEGLRELRGSPDLVMVGDEIVIPAPVEGRGVSVASGQRVTFQVRGEDVLRLRVRGILEYVRVFGLIPWRVELGDRTFEGELDEDTETIEAPLHPTAKTAVVYLDQQRLGEYDVGGLGPADEGKGAFARLVNLGFGAPPSSSGTNPGSDQVADPLTTAVQRFQRTHGLPVTGELDEPTLARLRNEYGA